ncbi:MAG: enoyl-CoA hydratase [Alphaproteobacteria bacterium]|nr:MAG: enoyl-CoA hydratase [Alphaproteobacteria bacterium]
MAYKNIIVDTEDNVCLIRLNRPEAMNALNLDLLGELGEALAEAQKNDKVRACVLTGSEKAFAAGADIKMMRDKSFVDVFTEDLFTPQERAVKVFRKPLIAAVAGYALGGGCELAMTADFIIAADTAKFGQPEVNLGVTPGMGGSVRLSRLVGRAKAMDMALTGRMMDAAEAERAGLVSRVVPAKKLIEEALAAARKIAEKSAISVMAIKEMVHRADEMPLSEAVLFERRLFHAMFATEDQKEGMSAFIEKRTPHFRDR